MAIKKVCELQEGEVITRTIHGITYAETVLGWYAVGPDTIKLRVDVKPMHHPYGHFGTLTYSVGREDLVTVLEAPQTTPATFTVEEFEPIRDESQQYGPDGTCTYLDDQPDDDPFDLARAAEEIARYND